MHSAASPTLSGTTVTAQFPVPPWRQLLEPNLRFNGPGSLVQPLVCFAGIERPPAIFEVDLETGAEVHGRIGGYSDVSEISRDVAQQEDARKKLIGRANHSNEGPVSTGNASPSRLIRAKLIADFGSRRRATLSTSGASVSSATPSSSGRKRGPVARRRFQRGCFVTEPDGRITRMGRRIAEAVCD
jgi:hypothetical protein